MLLIMKNIFINMIYLRFFKPHIYAINFNLPLCFPDLFLHQKNTIQKMIKNDGTLPKQ